jgi:hypothetical protein
LLGYAIIPFFCLAQYWTASISTAGPYKPHAIDRWRATWLNTIYGNPEDGVSGRFAIIWGSGPNLGVRVPYMQGRNPVWRACCWNYRNMANQLKRTWGLV